MAKHKPERVENIAQRLAASTRVEQQLQVKTTQFQGPIPDPETRKRYDQIHAGLADRILKMAESPIAHRHECERVALQAQVSDAKAERMERRLGQIFALTIGLLAIVASVYAVAKGHPVTGGFIGTGGVIGLVAVFLENRWNQVRQGVDSDRDVNSDQATVSTKIKSNELEK